MSFRYSINLPVSLSSTALIISSGKRLCANRSGARSYDAELSYARISYWVLDLNCACLIRMFWAGASSLFYLLMCWAASRGGTVATLPVVPPLEVMQPLEVLLLVISLGLVVTYRWDVGKVSGCGH